MTKNVFLLCLFASTSEIWRKKKLKKKTNFVPTYLLTFFLPCYQKQTYIFFCLILIIIINNNNNYYNDNNNNNNIK